MRQVTTPKSKSEAGLTFRYSPTSPCDPWPITTQLIKNDPMSLHNYITSLSVSITWISPLTDILRSGPQILEMPHKSSWLSSFVEVWEWQQRKLWMKSKGQNLGMGKGQHSSLKNVFFLNRTKWNRGARLPQKGGGELCELPSLTSA